jgi:hypothetical protein
MISDLVLLLPFNMYYQMFQIFFSILKYIIYTVNKKKKNRIIIERISEKEDFVLLDIKEI